MHLTNAIGLRDDRGLLADRIGDAPWVRRRLPYYVTAMARTADHSPCVPSVDLELVTSSRTILCEIAPFETRTSDQAGV
jgi:hypothetical protein